VWQQVYEEINDPDFVIISAAEDTGGEAVAGPIFDAASPSYIQVVDPDHIISTAFNWVNVPSAAWVDEEGRIVRIDEGTYAKVHEMGEGEQAITFGTDVFAPALKDWVQHGSNSRFVQSTDAVTKGIRIQSTDEQRAEAAFRLGNFFREHGQVEKTEQYWTMARELNPDSINYIRQHLTLTAEGSAGESFMNLMGRYMAEGKEYYRPMDLD
jgi:hypothetical protein